MSGNKALHVHREYYELGNVTEAETSDKYDLLPCRFGDLVADENIRSDKA